MKLSAIRNFIIRERLYIWLLIFIISVNIGLFLTREPAQHAEKDKGQIKQLLARKTFGKEDLLKIAEKNRPLGIILSLFSFIIFLTIAIGIFLDFIVFVVKKGAGGLIAPTVLPRPPQWGIWDVCKVAILFVWFGYIVMFMESFLAQVFPIIRHENFRALLNVTITDLLAFLFIIYFVVYEYRENLTSLGISFRNFFKNLFYGIAGYVSTVPILILSLLLIIWLSALFKYEPPMQPVLEIFLEEKKAPIITYLTIFAVVFGPVIEELFFRGFMYRAIKERWGFKAAIFSSSALFAFLHGNVIGFLPIMILGMLLAYLFEKTGTLVASCAVHILHNGVMVALVFVMKAMLK
jgi:uncharacterized protein